MASSMGVLPSPAVSDVDSLAGLDLDAFLDAQGPLSSFPTPVLAYKQRRARQTASCYHEPYTPPVDLTLPNRHQHNNVSSYAFAFLEAACPDHIDSSTLMTKPLANLFQALQLPTEVIAMAHMILSDYACSNQIGNSSSSVELCIASSLALADTYNNDHPWATSRWLIAFDCESITAAQLNQSMILMLQHLDWKIHSFCDQAAITLAMAILVDTAATSKAISYADHQHKIDTTVNATACWVNGQLTPNDSPPTTFFTH